MANYRLNHTVFWPPFGLLIATLVYSLYGEDQFRSTGTAIQSWILEYFDWLFNWSSFLFLCLIAIVYFSPLARIRIGGSAATPLLSKWKWFSVSLCTTIATGILFWGAAEPLYHLHNPGGILSESEFGAAKKMAMSSMFLHWTFTPYAVYTMAALTFALVFYNLNQPFRVASLLYPLTGKQVPRALASFIDAICLFALVAGMAASLGTGIMTISGGLNTLADAVQSPWTWALIAFVIVMAFVSSAVSGLKRGIAWLSDLNMRLFVVLGVFVLLAGPTIHMLQLGANGMIDYLEHFVPRSLGFDPAIERKWTHDWTSFYWANWMAWTPVSALFLGRLGRGYTVRRFIEFNWILPALFSTLWMTVFSGYSLHLDLSTDSSLYATLLASGPQNVIFSIFNQLPLTSLASWTFIGMVFLSFVTAADSNTSAMSAISTDGITATNQEAPLFIKIVWGLAIGCVSWVMISFSGIEGVKQISVIGGFPAMILLLAVFAALIKLCLHSKSLMN